MENKSRECINCGMPIPYSAWICPYCKYEDYDHMLRDYVPKPPTMKQKISRVIDKIGYFIGTIIIWLFKFAIILFILLMVFIVYICSQG